MKNENNDEVKITFLGTSDSTPCKDRFCTSMLLEVGDCAYIIDAGAPVTDILVRRNYDWSKIKALFNSHSHMDHIVGLFSFYSTCTCEIMNTNIDFYLPTQKLEDICNMITEAGRIKQASDRLRMHIYDDNLIFDDGHIRLTPVRNGHVGEGFNSFGFYIEAGNKKIIFTGDMSNGLEKDDFPKMAFNEHTDIIISECAHFSVACLAQCISKSKTDRFIVTHIYPYPDKVSQIEKMQKDFECEVIIAGDNEEFKI